MRKLPKCKYLLYSMNCEESGIVHLSDLPGNVRVILELSFHSFLIETLDCIGVTRTNQAGLLDISRTSTQHIREMGEMLSLTVLKKLLRYTKFSLDGISQHIVWIGHPNSQGITYPNLPFDFYSRTGARLVAGICNEGWISEACCYSNSSKQQRESLCDDALRVFGGKREQFVIHESESDTFIRFPAIVKEVFLVLTNFKGVKSVNNPGIPSFIFNSKEFMLGWIEQTIADEGTVKYYPRKYRREIWWKRAFLKSLDTYRLHEDECKIFRLLDLKYSTYSSWTYDSLSGKKVHAQIRIVGRRSILFLYEHLRIPLQRKQKLLGKMAISYERYKERVNIWSCIYTIAQTSGIVSTKVFQEKMNYKTVSTASKWLSHFCNQGRLRKVRRGFYVLSR